MGQAHITKDAAPFDGVAKRAGNKGRGTKGAGNKGDILNSDDDLAMT
jgi:hypothetical protein